LYSSAIPSSGSPELADLQGILDTLILFASDQFHPF